MKTTLTLTATLAAALFAGAAFADDEHAKQHSKMNLSGWDADGDKMVSMDEWGTAMEEHEVFDKIDKNGNGIFDIGESVDNFLDYDLSMDLDAGGHIERQEFVLGLFNSLDENDDDQLDQDEFSTFSTHAAGSPLLTSAE